MKISRTKSPTEVHSDGGSQTARSTKSGALSDSSTSNTSVARNEHLLRKGMSSSKSSSLLNIPSQYQRSKSSSGSSSSTSSNVRKSRPLVPRTQRAKSTGVTSKD